MFLGFEAQREFVERAEDVDWFLYLEDDLVLSDGLLLEKLASSTAVHRRKRCCFLTATSSGKGARPT